MHTGIVIGVYTETRENSLKEIRAITGETSTRHIRHAFVGRSFSLKTRAVARETLSRLNLRARERSI